MLSRKIFIAILFTASLASCKKIIETAPTHQLDGSERFKTIEDFDFALTGTYALMRSGNYLGSASNAFVNLPDMLSDNLNETSESLGNYQTLSTWVYAEDETNIGATWQAAYRIISQANLLLRNIDEFSATYAGAVNRIKAQALAIRAMVHFDLLRYWVEDYDRNSTKPGIPYITVFDYEQKPPRGTVKETYDHIEADLQMARGLLNSGLDKPINTTTSKAYIDIQGVNAIMARVFLYSNQLDNAIQYSTFVINAIPLASRTNFPNIWTDVSISEVIWSVSFNAGEGRVGDPVYFAPNNRSSYRPNPTLITLYDQVNDIRFSSYFSVINTGNPPNPNNASRRVLSKYLAKAAQLGKPDGITNFKAFRTGEMYLIRAEAYARKGGANEVSALADLNTLRAARIAGFVAGIETGAALINAIALERRKELISEGHRWFDLKRTTKTISRTNCTVFCTLDPSNRAWTWPIPIDEINANPNILPQNPGY